MLLTLLDLQEAYDRIRNMSIRFRICEEEVLVLAGFSHDRDDRTVPVIVSKASRKRGFFSFCLLLAYFSLYI